MTKATILIVENEGIVAVDLAHKLQRMGYEVVATAESGPEAIALAGRFRPQLVLMDILLEGPMDGIEAAETIYRQHDVPVVYLTAHSDPATLARAKLTEPFGYLLKPFEERELAIQLELALSKHQADRRIREQREWLRITLRSIGDAVIATDATGGVTFLNPIAASLTGWTENEAAGEPIQRVFPIVHEQTGQRVEDPVARVLRERCIVTLASHTALVTRDGRTIPVEDSAAPILNDTGQVIGVVLVFHDATAKRRAEQEKLDWERRLLQAQKLESLGVLAGGIAHDFNNILAGIMGYADLIKLRLPPSDMARTDLEVIKTSVRRAADLTRQMLAYSGVGKFIVEPVNLSRLVEKNQKLLAMSVSKKSVLAYDLAADVPEISADASQVCQVLTNLVTNASEALEDKGGVITITTRAVRCEASYLASLGFGDNLPAGLYACLEVADNGCGMDRETQEKAFDPFFSTKFTGRGLGLAAVHGIVRGHQGAIQISSNPGQGTVLCVLFPASERPLPVPSGESSAPAWRGCGTVLVVDDELLVRNLAQRMIEQLGFSVLAAADGEEAIRLYRRHHAEIACVLLDLTMPKMGGKETAHELQKIRPDVRIILSSGYGAEVATQRFPDQSLVGFIQKPYQLETMRSQLQAALAVSR